MLYLARLQVDHPHKIWYLVLEDLILQLVVKIRKIPLEKKTEGATYNVSGRGFQTSAILCESCGSEL